MVEVVVYKREGVERARLVLIPALNYIPMRHPLNSHTPPMSQLGGNQWMRGNRRKSRSTAGNLKRTIGIARRIQSDGNKLEEVKNFVKNKRPRPTMDRVAG